MDSGNIFSLRHAPNETPTERLYRHEREALNQWNSSFWTEHNVLYEKRKADFIAKKKNEIGQLEHINANDLSQFYREFLNERKVALRTYNKIWYKRNLALIWPALKVNLIRFARLIRRR
ncbi:unnamed protein product [Anisakis simplex]|uniref:Uncharacterized protein n=1 Tax=Anisakis simplex TaxID=6269 RepID=A0A3P6NBU2_ANISI|nr:unnamed protein product [Anisakis simplex]